MKRALLAALVLAVPLLGGFECTVEPSPSTFNVGDTCSYVFDANEAYCSTSDALRYCAWDNIVDEMSCADACGGAGSCDFDDTLGYSACICDSWAPGNTCDYEMDYASSTCSGDTLTYCATTNIIGAISCYGQCQDWYGADASGYCGIQADTGYNGCVCELPPSCTWSDYCYDALWLVQCVPDDASESWTDCNTYCQTEGFTKGVCDYNVAACSCT